MSKSPSDVSAETKTILTAQDLLGQATQSLDVFLKSVKRAKTALGRAKARFADWPIEAVEKLTTNWQPVDAAQLAHVDRCVNSLGGLLRPLRAEHVSRFRAELMRRCQDSVKGGGKV